MEDEEVMVYLCMAFCQIWLPVICVQAFGLLPGLAVLRSRSHDSSSDVIDWPMGGMQPVDVIFSDRLSYFGNPDVEVLKKY